MSPKWQIRSPQPPIPEKQQQFGSYPQIKQFCKSLGARSRNFSSTVEPKNLKITTPKEKKNSFIFVCTSHPHNGTAQTQAGTPQIERDPLARKGSLGWATSFPSLWGHLKKDPFQFHPLHRPAKLRCIGKAKNTKKNKGRQCQLHSRSNLVPCSAEDKDAWHWGNQWPAQLSWTFCRFPWVLPHGTHVHGSQPPESLPAPSHTCLS